MDSWLVPAANLCLSCFQVVVAGSFLWIVARLATGARSRAPVSGLGRFCLEYLGNVDPPGSAERRRNLRGRELIDWVKYQIEHHPLPAGQEQRLLSLARQVVRDEAPPAVEDGPRSGIED